VFSRKENTSFEETKNPQSAYSKGNLSAIANSISKAFFCSFSLMKDSKEIPKKIFSAKIKLQNLFSLQDQG